MYHAWQCPEFVLAGNTEQSLLLGFSNKPVTGQLTFLLPWVPGLPQRTSLSVSQSGSWGESSVTEQTTAVRL